MAISERLSSRQTLVILPERMSVRGVLERLARTPWTLVFFLQVAVGLTALAVYLRPQDVPWSAATFWLVLGGLFLPPRPLLVSYALNVATMVVCWRFVTETKPSFGGFLIGHAACLALLFWVAQHRSRAGVTGVRGEEMISEMRERLNEANLPPVLPHDWKAEVCVQPALGDTFAGDLVLSQLSVDGTSLQVMVIDLSGKGKAAGARGLLLSGAMRSLLGAGSGVDVLGAANRHLSNHQREEEFATAAYAQVNLETGEYTLAYAGHPPAVQYFAGTGRWRSVRGGRGPALGIIEGVRFPFVTGVLGRGDALILYSDGVIEARDRSLQEGLDGMLGRAERRLSSGFGGLAELLCENAPAKETDDRGVFLLYRQ